MSKKYSLKYYPIAVKLKNLPALVVGGGKVAQRKVEHLLESGANVRVISPKGTAALRRLAKKGKIEWIRRGVSRNDLTDTAITVAATNDKHINALISRWAKERLILINAVDKPDLSTFISPAVFRSKKGIIAVYTDGKDPVLSRDLKNFLKERWNDFLSYRDRS